MRPVVRAPVPALARRVDGATVVFLTAAAPRATRAKVAAPDERGAALGWLDVRYDFDPGRYARRARVRVRDVTGPAVLVDPFGGAPRRLPVRPVADEPRTVEVDVPFDTGPAAVLVLPAAQGREPDEPVDSGARSSTTTVEIPPDAEWDMVLVPTLDNTWGDFARPATGPPAGPAVTECRTFRHRVEAAGEDGVRDGWASAPPGSGPPPATVRATFGPRALVLREGPGRDGPSVLEWSETLGVHKDPVHRAVLGPKGHVPEEFMHIGRAVAGEVVRLRTGVCLDEDFDGHLAIGAGAAKRVRLDGVPVALGDGGHLATGPVRMTAGFHLLELDLAPEQDGDLRAHLALVRDPGRYRRPEWIRAAGTMGTTLKLTALPVHAVVQVAAQVPCALRINGRLIGGQGGFDPYAEHAVPRVRRHDVTAALRIGDNDITVETSGSGERAVLVDAVLDDEYGEPVATLHSDARWWAQGPQGRGPVGVRREPVGDPAALCLRRRPHPLPGTAWLDPEADDGTVVPVRFAVPGRRGGTEWLWCELPPGTTRLTAQVHGEVALHVDGAECPAVVSAADARGVRTVTADLPPGDRGGPRTAALRVRTCPGYEGGAALAGPVRCVVGPGRIRLGDWEGQGLAEYSGGVRYGREVTVPAEAVAGRVSLDLGRVRGTAEVRVGGVVAGVRVCSPYVFDLTGLVVPGANAVEITVFGTLAPRLDSTSPTHFVFPGQRVSGLLGPVRLRTERG
ncbi:hypothetical protein [Streptomyces sp. NPDC001948]